MIKNVQIWPIITYCTFDINFLVYYYIKPLINCHKLKQLQINTT